LAGEVCHTQAVQKLSRLAAPDATELRAWLERFTHAVRARDATQAAPLFRPGVIGFGSVARVAIGVDALQREQWSAIWPRSTAFAFDAEPWVTLSEDGCSAVIASQWTSTGYHANGGEFERPGRCTLVLVRSSRQAEWQAVHTHFSLAPGTPQATFEPPPSR
jgi:hypothetical protein